MKLSYNWIKEHYDKNLSVTELSDNLTNVGLVVEEVKEIGNDYCLDMEITANRPDCLGMIGVSREIRAITGCNIKHPDLNECDEKSNKQELSTIKVNITDKTICPRYIAQKIENVKIAPSPEWLQQRLTTIGIRCINNVVDITNYVLIESGQPLHAFDFEKLSNNEINVRNAKAAEKMVSIDGTEQVLTPEMLVIADSEKPVAIAGVMGGLDTEITDSTKTILLECARFEPTSVRKTSKQLGLTTDSSYRFERGTDPNAILWTANRAAKMIEEIAGGKITGYTDSNHETEQKIKTSLRIKRINKVLGIDIEKIRVKKILEDLGFIVYSEIEEKIEVIVPSYRNDISREIDLIEEIIRIYGYDKIPAKTKVGVEVRNRKNIEIATDNVRELLTGQGYYEVISFSIVEDPPPKHKVNVWNSDDNLVIINPLSKTENKLRNTLLFNCLKIMKHNHDRGANDINIFEISNVYLPNNGNKLPDEKRCLGILAEKGFLELKGIIESIINISKTQSECNWSYEEFSFFNNNTSAIIKIDGELLGYIGEINKGLRDIYGLNKSVCFAEIDFDLLLSKFSTNKNFKKLPSFPGITRDVAIVIDEKVRWEDICKCIKSENIAIFDSIKFFDIFRGKQIEIGKKSIAFSVNFRLDERTLKSEEADEAVELILGKLNSNFKAEIRVQ